jgi:hypothetical protein
VPTLPDPMMATVAIIGPSPDASRRSDVGTDPSAPTPTLLFTTQPIGDPLEGRSAAACSSTVVAQPLCASRVALTATLKRLANPGSHCVSVGGGPGDAFDQLSRAVRALNVDGRDAFTERKASALVTG